jgi:uncharacterized Tic20 family protein
MNEPRLAARCHLAFLAAFLSPVGGALAAWLLWRRVRHLSAFAEEHAREALNFQLTIMLGLLASWLMIFSVTGLVTMPLLLILNTAFAITAYRRARRRCLYRYPLCWRFID